MSGSRQTPGPSSLKHHCIPVTGYRHHPSRYIPACFKPRCPHPLPRRIREAKEFSEVTVRGRIGAMPQRGLREFGFALRFIQAFPNPSCRESSFADRVVSALQYACMALPTSTTSLVLLCFGQERESPGFPHSFHQQKTPSNPVRSFSAKPRKEAESAGFCSG